jgi:hypothetical protein
MDKALMGYLQAASPPANTPNPGMRQQHEQCND